jgi:hypothetical protein
MQLKFKTFRKVTAGLVTVFLLALLVPAAVFGQAETGQIVVKVTDSSGAAVNGATVTAKSAATGVERTAKTNEEGVVTITSLQPGRYTVKVEGSGFAAYTQEADVSVGARLSIEASMSAQAKAESVTVVAGEGGVEVNTQTQQLADTISQRQITELPTLTRNPYDLVGLSGNVSPADPSARGAGFAINGQRAASTNILLDGGENVDTFVAAVGQGVPLDSVQEFQVITSNFSAEYGRASGGIVNSVSKAGSSALHGSIYEFNRVSALAANSFDQNAQGIEKGVFTRNQFGYSVGGPIIKEKLFFFSSTEWTRIRSQGEEISLVPTPQLIGASNINTRNYFNAFQLENPINGQVFTVNQVISSLGGSGAFAPSNPFLGLPGGLPAFGQVRVNRAQDQGGGAPGNNWQTVGRFDYNWSDKTQIYFRGAFEQGDNPLGTVSFSPFVGFNTGQNIRNQNYLTSVTHTFSPTLVGTSKVVFNRLLFNQPLGEQPLVPTLFTADTFVGRINGFTIRYPGYLADAPGNGIPFGGPQNFLQLFQDMNWTKGNHQLRFGGQYVHIRDNRTFGAYEYADASLGTSNQTALGNLVAGQLNNFTVAVFPQGKFPCAVSPTTGAAIVTPECTVQTPLTSPNFSRSNRYHEWAAYFNDSWKIKPRVTLNLGVRYEYYGTQHNAVQELDSNFYFGSGGSVFERIRNGRMLSALDSPQGALWAPDYNNFAPRLGFAWDVFGDGTTSLRGGYGMAYERNFGNVTFNVIQNPPNYATVAVRNGVEVPAGQLPITLDNFGPLGGAGISKPLPTTSLRVVDPDIVNAYAHFWSLAFQRQLGTRTVASLEYTGSAGRNLYSISNINRVGAGAIYLGDARAFNRLNLSGPSSINFRGSDGRSNYNALIASLETSNWHGVRATMRYTYAHTRDNLSSTFSESGNNFNLGYLDPFDPDLDYGFADFDVRHRFISSFTWDLPTVASAKGFLGQVVNGWELSGIFGIRTGTPFTVFDCTNGFNVCMRTELNGPVNFKGSVGHNSVGVSGSPNRYNYIDLSGLTPGQFFDTLGFADYAPFPADMSDRGQFRGPGFWNLDAGVYKNFKLTERFSLQMRFEAFNVFNHANLFIVGSEAEVNTGFVPAFFDGRRNVQLAAKVIF